MPSVLIAGHGYVGAAAAALFHDSGWSVEGWSGSVASAKQAIDAKYVVRAVDIRKKDEISQATAGFDVVIHSASTRGGDIDDYRRLYLDGARNLLGRFPDSRLLLIGSTSVYGQKDGELVTEENASEPEHERGKILRDTEEMVLKAGGIVARLSGIYGPGRSFLLQRFLSGEAVIESDRFVNQIHRDDAASAIFLLANKISESARQIFNVTDDQSILQSECYRWLANRLNRPLPPTGKHVSSGKRGRSNKRVSNAKLRALGWSLQFPTFAEAMESSILPSFDL
jgi:nucleoside-diphosphate-sugar epimerase